MTMQQKQELTGKGNPDTCISFQARPPNSYIHFIFELHNMQSKSSYMSMVEVASITLKQEINVCRV